MIFFNNKKIKFYFLIALNIAGGGSLQAHILFKKNEQNSIQTWHKDIEVTKLLELNAQPINKELIQDNEWKELSCDAMLSKINHTITCFGSWGLKQSFHPIVDKNAIMLRQQQLGVIIENEELYTQLREALLCIKENEDALIAYYNDANLLHNEAKKSYYSLFPSYLNTSRIALDASFAVDIAKYGSLIAAYLGISGLINNSFAPDLEPARQLQKINDAMKNDDLELLWSALEDVAPLFDGTMKKDSWLVKIKKGFYAPIISHIPWPVNLADNKERMLMRKFPTNYLVANNNSMGDAIAIYTEGFNYPQWLATLFAAGYVLVTDLHAGYMLKSGFDQLKAAWSMPDQLKVELIKVAHFMHALEKMFTVAKQSEFLSSFDSIKHLDELFNGSNKSFASLLFHLREIRNAESVFYSRGRTLLVHKLLHDIKNELIPFMNDIAYIDALLSVATTYKERSESYPWTFATFIDEKEPIIALKDFWLPFINNAHVVLNSISLGGQEKNKVILTGPNGGGKSTIMKAIVYQIIFAQSWGIVPAGDAQMGFFTGVRTALNPQEDIQRKLSTFMAQKLRMEEIASFIKSATADDNFFVAIDEPFRGTVEYESQKRVYAFACDIAFNKQTTLVMATHFEKPTQLEVEFPSSYINYQCEFMKTADNKLQRTYKLLPGAALWWFHDDAMRSLYIDCLEVDDTVAE